MAVLVTGATGFVGAALVDHLRAAGRSVTGTSRAQASGLLKVGEIDGATDWRTALRGVRAVVHCAGIAHSNAGADDYQRVNVEGSLNLARQAATAGVRRFVFISSAGVHGDGPGPFTADTPPNPRKPYAESKVRAEDGLRAVAAETGMELVIIRPPLVTGPGVKGNLALLAKLVRTGLPTPFGLTRNRRDVVSLPVLCRVIEACITAPVAGQTFLVSDRRPLSTREMVDRVAEDHGLRKPLHLPVPTWLLGAALGLAGMKEQRSQLLGDLEVDAEPARRLIGL